MEIHQPINRLPALHKPKFPRIFHPSRGACKRPSVFAHDERDRKPPWLRGGRPFTLLLGHLALSDPKQKTEDSTRRVVQPRVCVTGRIWKGGVQRGERTPCMHEHSSITPLKPALLPPLLPCVHVHVHVCYPCLIGCHAQNGMETCVLLYSCMSTPPSLILEPSPPPSHPCALMHARCPSQLPCPESGMETCSSHVLSMHEHSSNTHPQA